MVLNYILVGCPWANSGYGAFSLIWPASMQIYWNKRKRSHRKEFNSHRTGLEHQHGRPSLFCNTDMAAMTSCENALYTRDVYFWLADVLQMADVISQVFLFSVKFSAIFSSSTKKLSFRPWPTVPSWLIVAQLTSALGHRQTFSKFAQR